MTFPSDDLEFKTETPAPRYSQFILVRCPDCGQGRYGLKKRPATWGHCQSCRQRQYKYRCICHEHGKTHCRRHCHKGATGFAQPFEVTIYAE